MGLALLKQTDAQQKTIIVGLGKTGLSCARFLAREGCDVLVVDSRAEPPGIQVLRDELPDVEIRLGAFDSALFKLADMLVVSPGVSLRAPAIAVAVEAGVEVVGDVELFARHANAPVVAITGSNGKSTVTMLIGEMAQAAGKDVRVGGNIGTPALDLLQANEPDLYVLELSSFQLETTLSLKAEVAVVLNVSQDHLDRYHNMQEYAEAKYRIYNGATHKFVNLDDPVVAKWQGDAGWHGFSLSTPESETDFGLIERNGQAWLAKGEACLMLASELKLTGRHNVANALAALALGGSVGLNMASMLETLRRFAGLPHRCQWLAKHNGVNWYNDSKATNVGAAVAAVNGMPGKVVLLAGGEGKGQDFSALKTALASNGRAAIVFGRDADLLAQSIDKAVPVHRVATLKQAVEMASRVAQEGDAVLLAPACASFDMFSSYEERGNQFAAAVAEVLA